MCIRDSCKYLLAAIGKGPRMQRLIILVLGIAILWSGFWFWGAERNKAGIAALVAGAEKSGWQIQFEQISQMGFPNRYDVTLRNPQISNAAGTFDWQRSCKSCA